LYNGNEITKIDTTCPAPNTPYSITMKNKILPIVNTPYQSSSPYSRIYVGTYNNKSISWSNEIDWGRNWCNSVSLVDINDEYFGVFGGYTTRGYLSSLTKALWIFRLNEDDSITNISKNTLPTNVISGPCIYANKNFYYHSSSLYTGNVSYDSAGYDIYRGTPTDDFTSISNWTLLSTSDSKLNIGNMQKINEKTFITQYSTTEIIICTLNDETNSYSYTTLISDSSFRLIGIHKDIIYVFCISDNKLYEYKLV